MVIGGQDVYRAGGYQDSALAEILPFDLSTRIAKEDQFEGKFFVNIPKAAYEHPMLQLLPSPPRTANDCNALPSSTAPTMSVGFKPLATPLMTRTLQAQGEERQRHREGDADHGIHGGRRRQGAGHGGRYACGAGNCSRSSTIRR